ncbi:iron-containing alcohol dehydrogenase family protein [Paenibacillus sp. HWE-109]|uniref:iron-containing alcohol dehydrogenase family protein n=1 Tax=Paenibacillus sp. HWE-109 TaxID=1306526 RepID=UPI001EDD28F7|nr:iron-containing alcohol dehydrogenase family protein [Paenibacillus sp. HWE-109]UKS28797.1 iron-containing alcohol dehydrogenase family protein [Paenibacillus sp. HWE-109]
MISFKAPNQYWNESHILAKGGALIAPLGQKALIIAGKQALEAISSSSFLLGLQESGITYSIALFSGKVTTTEIQTYRNIAADKEVDVIIGIGGGKSLDISKAVADHLGIPVVAVPTIAATCASWAALSVLYDELGRSSSYRLLKQSPSLVLADLQVLVAAPKRYLASGIGDTLVKWYETVVNHNEEPDGLDIRISIQIAKLALERLQIYAKSAYEAAGTGEVTPAFKEAVDAVIVLAGLAGSAQGNTPRAGIAHGIHNSLTFLPETKDTLHGEKVAFGLLTQVVLEKRAEDEIHRLASLLHQLQLPITLKELGIEQPSAEVAATIAQGVQLREEAISHLSFAVNETLLAQAIQTADQWGQRIAQENYVQQ